MDLTIVFFSGLLSSMGEPIFTLWING
jgi:hypothetical protein